MSDFAAKYARFFWAGLVKHGQTGGIVPSQRFLIEKMIASVPEAYSGRLVELGAGTGALTFRLAARCPAARILACEINPALARDLGRNLKNAGLGDRVELFAGSATQLLSNLDNGNAPRPDFVISGIPLGNMGRERAHALIGSVRRVLSEKGRYIQFQHSLLDRKKIRMCFPHLRTTPVLLNFPPAVVYCAFKSAPAGVQPA